MNVLFLLTLFKFNCTFGTIILYPNTSINNFGTPLESLVHYLRGSRKKKSSFLYVGSQFLSSEKEKKLNMK